jgi:hypothetical protein
VLLHYSFLGRMEQRRRRFTASLCRRALQGRGAARIDQLAGSRGSLRAWDAHPDDELENANGPQEHITFSRLGREPQ